MDEVLYNDCSSSGRAVPFRPVSSRRAFFPLVGPLLVPSCLVPSRFLPPRRISSAHADLPNHETINVDRKFTERSFLPDVSHTPRENAQTGIYVGISAVQSAL